MRTTWWVETKAGGELGIEDEFAGHGAGLGLPEVDEAQDLIGLVGFGHGGVAVAEHALLGVAGEKDPHALLVAAAPRDIVLLEGLLLGVGRQRVVVEIERATALQAGVLDVVEPLQIPRTG